MLFTLLMLAKFAHSILATKTSNWFVCWAENWICTQLVPKGFCSRVIKIYNFFTRYKWPDLVLHLFTFLCSPIIFLKLILDFIKLLRTHDFSRVTFGTELSTNLVYKSIFVLNYNYISIHLLFFFTVKLSIFSRLCVKHKRVMSRSTHTEV